jgi:DNA-binding LytR/AlgR family response regulator
MKIRCIIVDDEFLARTLLEDYVSKVPQLELVAKCQGAPQALEVLQNENIDLMFLDVQMPDLTGVDFLKSLSQKPVVIFTTAYSDYAIDGYSLGVIEYLLKPISFERFFQAVNKAVEQINLIRKSRSDEPDDFIMLKSEHRIHKVKHNEILYIEGLKEYVIFHLKNEKRIITLRSIKSLEESLPGNFMRIHRSYIINKNEISTLYRNMVEIGKRKIDIGKTYKEKVMDELMKK